MKPQRAWILIVGLLLAVGTLGCPSSQSRRPQAGSRSPKVTDEGEPSIRLLSDEANVLKELVSKDAYVYEFRGSCIRVWLEYQIKDEQTGEVTPPVRSQSVSVEMHDLFDSDKGEEYILGSVSPDVLGKIIVYGNTQRTLNLSLLARHPKATTLGGRYYSTPWEDGSAGQGLYRKSFSTNDPNWNSSWQVVHALVIPPLERQEIAGWQQTGSGRAGLLPDLPDNAVRLRFSSQAAAKLPEDDKEFIIFAESWRDGTRYKRIDADVDRTRKDEVDTSEISRVITVRLKGRRLTTTQEGAIAEIMKLGGQVYSNMSPSVSKVDLSETEVTDAGLEYLNDLPDLRELRLDRTQVSNKGLEHLKGLINLERLNLGETQVTDAGLARSSTP